MSIFGPDFRIPRRRWLRTFALTTSTSWVLGKHWTAPLLADIQVASNPTGALFLARISDHPALQMDYGSVRIGTSPIQSDHYPSGLFYPVLINRAPNNQFYALDAQCTHAGCTVPVFDARAQYSECPCHGSRYGVDGRLLRGPAGFPLRQFKMNFDGRDQLTIELQNVQGLDGFLIAVSKITAAANRLELKFLAFQNIQYEIWTRETATGAWQPSSFAQTPTGAINQTVFTGQDDYASLYVPIVPILGCAVLYAVVMRTQEV